MATEHYKQARQRLNAFMKRHPEDIQARFLQGLVLLREGRIKRATAVFETITQEYPDLPESYNNLAVLYAAQGQYEKARDILLAAMHTHPSYAKVHENLGGVYAKMASLAYDRALERNHKQKTPALKLDLLTHLSVVQNGAKNDISKPETPQANHTQSATRQPEASASSPSLPSQPSQRMAAKTPEANQAQIVATISAWAKAWSEQDVDAYLAFYAADFKPPQGISRRGWRNQRRQRLRAPRFIKVELSNPEVTLLENGTASVQFLQDYRSNIFRGKSYKQLHLIKHDAKWHIVEERIILE
jgi:tetratricopeptide (TPR) repeat protein